VDASTVFFTQFGAHDVLAGSGDELQQLGGLDDAHDRAELTAEAFG
jgi:hypothetical protein